MSGRVIQAKKWAIIKKSAKKVKKILAKRTFFIYNYVCNVIYKIIYSIFS